jgi:hypothetical protein
MLTATEGRDLLVAALGTTRVTAEATAASELIALCGGLALALRVAAAHLVARPDLRLADYVETLRSCDVVDALRVEGDELANLAAAFDASYRLLEPDHRRLLQVLCHVPGPDFTVAAAAAAAGIPDASAAAGIDLLAARNLLERLPSRRYHVHDLIRRFARGRSRDERAETESEPVSAVVRSLRRTGRHGESSTTSEIAVPQPAELRT